MTKESTKEIRTPVQSMSLERYVKVLISTFLMSILFFLLMTLAIKADTRTSGLIANPFPYILICANIAGAIFHISFITTRKIESNIINSILTITTIVICNIVLGSSAYSYLTTLRVEKLLILLFAWLLLKYVVSNVIRYIYKIIDIRSSNKAPS